MAGSSVMCSVGLAEREMMSISADSCLPVGDQVKLMTSFFNYQLFGSVFLSKVPFAAHGRESVASVFGNEARTWQ